MKEPIRRTAPFPETKNQGSERGSSGWSTHPQFPAFKVACTTKECLLEAYAVGNDNAESGNFQLCSSACSSLQRSTCGYSRRNAVRTDTAISSGSFGLVHPSGS